MSLIIEMLKKSCLEHGDKAAFRTKVAKQWVDYSYRDLWRTSDWTATALEQWGLEPGDRCALLAPSSPAWVVAYTGILKANGVAVPVDKELKQIELRHVLANSGARVLFTEQPYLDSLLEIAEDLPDLEKIIFLNQPPSVEGQLTPQIETILATLLNEWRALIHEYQINNVDQKRLETLAQNLQQVIFPEASAKSKHKKDTLLGRLLVAINRNLPRYNIESFSAFQIEGKPPGLIRNPSDPAVILYTSGTTGRSKGAMLSHYNIASNIKTCAAAFRLDQTIHTLSFLPINHVFEQVGGILLPLSVGGTISFAESLKKLGDNLAEVKPNFLLGVPAVFRLLLDRMTKKIESQNVAKAFYHFPLTRAIVTKKIREAFGGNPTFISGGAALDPQVADGLMGLGIEVYQGYGITETSPVITLETPGARRLGSSGKPIDGVEVKINSPNDEGIGEIWVKGPNVMLGYHNNPEATAEVITDGWYHTGDLGRIDDDGFLTICGRVKNLIVTPNGKNVYPEEVENELLNSPYIAEIMVYGHKVDTTSEEVYAMIYPDYEALDEYVTENQLKSLDNTEIEVLLRQEVLKYSKNLADYKRVKRFTIREDEFPKTTTRKIKRFVVEADIITEH
ncbi:MAG: long-chain fatty acid--CoA ligase [Deltaproteobacteria bacterium]|nr:long-chain fatty acid--CoA ligase [Deltaproteobacteria bacterium]MBW2503977.1 long-chain fatty acid--CoA ligase [Deltaproteobacteria bacterium]